MRLAGNYGIMCGAFILIQNAYNVGDTTAGDPKIVKPLCGTGEDRSSMVQEDADLELQDINNCCLALNRIQLS